MQRFKNIIVLTLLLLGSILIAEAVPNTEYKVIKCDEQSGVCIARDKVLRYGLMTRDNKLLTQFEFSRIKNVSSNLYLVTKNNKDGLIDNQGQIVLEPNYQIRPSRIEKTLQYSLPFDDNFGLISLKTGQVLIKNEYSNIIKDSAGNYIVEKNFSQNQNGVLNSEGKQIIPTEYYFIMLMNGNKYYRLDKEVNNTDKFGVADLNGKIIVPVECSWIDKKPNGFIYGVKKNDGSYKFNAQTGSLTKE